MLLTSFFDRIKDILAMDLLTIASCFACTIAAWIDISLLIGIKIAPWKKTVVFFVVTELAAAVVGCWLGVSFVPIVGWCAFGVVTAAVLFCTIYLFAIKWKTN